jgi:hypothetical protein
MIRMEWTIIVGWTPLIICCLFFGSLVAVAVFIFSGRAWPGGVWKAGREGGWVTWGQTRSNGGWLGLEPIK